MSTHAFISRVIDSSSVEGIYCHFDGYPKGVGQILLQHYDIEKTKELLKLGNISSLEKELYPKTNSHSFQHPEEGVTVAYGRDRKEKGQESKFFLDSKIMFMQRDIDWFHLLKEDGEWMVRYYNWDTWFPLKTLINQMLNGVVYSKRTETGRLDITTGKLVPR